jgi:hypothetical protein
VARAPTDGCLGYRRLKHAPAHLLAESIVGTSTVIARRDALQSAGGFDNSLRSASDRDLWLRLAATGPVAFTPALGARCLALRSDRAGSEARVRVACMRRILEIHAPYVALDRKGAGAVRLGWANLLEAEAELARLEGRHRSAVAADLHALIHAPSLRLTCAVMADFVRAAASLTER